MDEKYRIPKRQLFVNVFIIMVSIFGIAKVFYNSFVAGIILLPLSIPLILKRKKKILENRKKKMESQFKDMLISMADAMEAGYSVENAIKESYRDLLSIYGYDSDICIELRLIISRLKFNISVEMIIESFAERTNLDNAKMFSQVFSVAKRTGGNMTWVMKDVANNIKQKELVKEEIDIVISSKKYEQKIMMVIPIFLMLYVSVASPGFLDVMYCTWQGRIIMTIFMVCYIAAYLWAEKITSIKN